MHKKETIYLILLIMLSCSAYSEIAGSVKNGGARYYITSDSYMDIYLKSFDPITKKAHFIINDNDFKLLPLQKIEIDDLEFIFIGYQADSLKGLTASFLIVGNKPFECSKNCENNSFVDFVKFFYKDFELCKVDCRSGCNLYNEKICIGDEIWTIDNCKRKKEKIEVCEEDCLNAGCTDCGNSRCEKKENYLNCNDCTNHDGLCIGDEDCIGKRCINGICTDKPYIVDDICSPEENCTSPDCSCSPLNNTKNDYPILIIHGFGSDVSKLKNLQSYLSSDLNYENAGKVSASHIDCSTDKKRSVYVATYYKKIKEKEKKTGLEQYISSTLEKIEQKEGDEKSDFINKLSEVISKIKACSGSQKVNIIAHSWGGVIARNYIIKKDNVRNIEKLIILGTPNHGGVYGEQKYELVKGLEASLGERKELLKRCSSVGMPSVVMTFIDGRDITSECSQLQKSNILADPIIRRDETPGPIEYYTIAGDIDGRGDGVVEKESVILSGAKNSIVDCGHFDLKNPARCPEAYSEIVRYLGFDSEEDINRGFLRTIARWFSW